MDKFLITGGAGFIGSHLSQRLIQAGKQIAVVDNLDEYYPAEFKRANLKEISATGNFEFFPIDIRDAEKLGQTFSAFNPDVVIHLAARPGVRISFVQPEAYTSINVLGTTQVLEISRLAGVQKVLFASSSSVYGHSSQAPFQEDAIITQPLSIYAATKVAGEALAFTYSHAYNLPVTCLRLFTVYGPRQRPDLAIRKFANLILEGKEHSHLRRWQPRSATTPTLTILWTAFCSRLMLLANLTSLTLGIAIPSGSTRWSAHLAVRCGGLLSVNLFQPRRSRNAQDPRRPCQSTGSSWLFPQGDV